jgi:hypothetical protein
MGQGAWPARGGKLIGVIGFIGFSNPLAGICVIIRLQERPVGHLSSLGQKNERRMAYDNASYNKPNEAQR